MATGMRKMNVISRCEAIYRLCQSEDGLPGVYHSYILAIHGNPGLSQDKLAKHMCINKSSVTRHIAYLEKNGYVKRKVSKTDKREMLVYPTQKMEDNFEEIYGITKKWNSLIAEGITKEEFETFNNILDKIYDNSMKIIYPEDEEK